MEGQWKGMERTSRKGRVISFYSGGNCSDRENLLGPQEATLNEWPLVTQPPWHACCYWGNEENEDIQPEFKPLIFGDLTVMNRMS